MEALINISPVGVLVFDAGTADLVSINDETRRIVGKLNAPSRSLSQFLEVIALRRADGSDIPMEELPTVKLARGETVLADEVVIHSPDGRARITTLVNARPMRGQGGEVVSVVATLQDITPLEEMKRQRADFLSKVSHELRTPLTAIRGSTTTLLNSNYPLDPAETRQFLRVIDEQSDHMRHLINDLVDMTHIEAGTLSVNPEPTDVADLLDQAREAHVHSGAANNSVELDLPPGLPRVMADQRRILQVLGNLLASVSQYSSKSSTVRIGALPRDLYVAVTVDKEGDEGDGAAAPRPPRQLGRLSRAADEVVEMRNGRDDLGIAISVGMVEAHGGRLSVEVGEEGRGSGFTFTVPVVDEAEYLAEQGPARSPSARDSDRGRARILAIGENPETARYLRSTLSQAGFDAVVTGNLDEAEGTIESQKPHVVLLEPTLPWADGFEMLERVGRISDTAVSGGQLHPATTHGRAAFGVIDGLVPQQIGFPRPGLVGRLLPAQPHSDSRHQPAWREGLDDVVVGSRLKCPQHVLITVVAGQEDDRRVNDPQDALLVVNRENARPSSRRPSRVGGERAGAGCLAVGGNVDGRNRQDEPRAESRSAALGQYAAAVRLHYPLADRLATRAPKPRPRWNAHFWDGEGQAKVPWWRLPAHPRSGISTSPVPPLRAYPTLGFSFAPLSSILGVDDSSAAGKSSWQGAC